MKKFILFLGVISIVLLLLSGGYCSAQDTAVYYARCNLKVIKGNHITWINWQSTPTYIPVGEKIRIVDRGKNIVKIETIENGKEYTLDIGNYGDIFLEKFITGEKVDISKFPEEVQKNIRNLVARVDMTKEQVYIAMGPPTKVVDGKTNRMTYEDIIDHDLWVYARRRFGKNIGVAFDPKTGLVTRTEGIWGK
ncbi:MAG: hypothetical protein ACMUIU_08430 [bacterium]